MPEIHGIFESAHVVQYLHARGLLAQYQKAKVLLLSGDTNRVLLKKRQPRKDNIWSFRINKQFRAYGVFDQDGNCIVFHINNHQ